MSNDDDEGVWKERNEKLCKCHAVMLFFQENKNRTRTHDLQDVKNEEKLLKE